MKTHLSLNTEKIETMLIKTFGSDKGNKQEWSCTTWNGSEEWNNIWNISIHYTIHLWTIVHSINNLRYREVQLRSNLELADSPSGDKELNIDILIGSEYYWKPVTGEVIREDGGPIALHTNLGWVLSGPLT